MQNGAFGGGNDTVGLELPLEAADAPLSSDQSRGFAVRQLAAFDAVIDPVRLPMLALIDIRRSGKSWPGSNHQSKSGQQIRFHDLSPLRLRFDCRGVRSSSSPRLLPRPSEVPKAWQSCQAQFTCFCRGSNGVQRLLRACNDV